MNNDNNMGQSLDKKNLKSTHEITKEKNITKNVFRTMFETVRAQMHNARNITIYIDAGG